MTQCLILLIGCESGVDPEPRQSFPVGAPNWEDPSYAWISDRLNMCGPVFRTPRTTFKILDVNARTGDILIKSGLRLYTYSPVSHSIRLVTDLDVAFAVWNTKGTLLIARVTPQVSWTEQLLVKDELHDSTWFVPLPDSIRSSSSVVKWLPGDSTILFPAQFAKSGAVCEFRIRDSVSFHPWNTTTTMRVVVQDDKVFVVQQYDINSVGKYARIELQCQNRPSGSLSMSAVQPAIWSMKNNISLSPDGQFLASPAYLSLDNTVHDLGPGNEATNWIPALIVFDVRPTSKHYGQIYRSFVDYNYGFRYCSTFFGDPGVGWSPDSKALIHEWIRERDSTMQIVRTDLETGDRTEITNWQSFP